MKYQVKLTEADYINFQLFEASINPLKVKQRRKSWILLILTGLSIAVVGYLAKENILLYYGIICTILFVVFGRLFLKWRNKKHYTLYVKNRLKDVSDENAIIEITADTINIEDSSMTGNVKIDKILLVNETGQYFFLNIATGGTLVIPKSFPNLNQEVYEMIKGHDISHNVHLNWKW